MPAGADEVKKIIRSAMGTAHEGLRLRPATPSGAVLSVERFSWRVGFFLPLVLLTACGETPQSAPAPAPAATAARPQPKKPPVRMTMDALHKLGGVPAGWQLTPPPGDVAKGRALFVDYGCHSCHRVEGEAFSEEAGSGGVGPDLTGMGAHHPPAYFAEAILNPDAILIEGDGYISETNTSTMPVYPDMTLAQLGDIVAYLGSLTTGGAHAGMDHAAMGHAAMGHTMPGGPPTAATTPPLPPSLLPKPTAPPTPARSFFVQTYDVLPGRVADFESWFEREGRQRFAAVPGLVSLETFVDTTRSGASVTTIFGFEDDQSLNDFMNDHDPGTMSLGLAFDGFIGTHDHTVFRQSPIYRAPKLSFESPPPAR